MWQFDRKPWRYDSGGTTGGLFKSSDGGRTWKKITNGLPALIGRIGVKVAPSNPRIVYVVAESKEGSLFRSQDGGESFEVVNKDRSLTTRGYYYCDLRVDPKDENRVYVLEGALEVSTDGGKSFSRIGGSVHGDLQALWIDPQDPARMWQGSDGGLASTWDMGQTWQHVSNISLGQFYHVYADNRKPFYDVSGGTQDNGTWIGPSQTREPSGILNDDWRMISTIVGFNVLSESDDPDTRPSLRHRAALCCAPTFVPAISSPSVRRCAATMVEPPRTCLTALRGTLRWCVRRSAKTPSTSAAMSSSSRATRALPGSRSAAISAKPTRRNGKPSGGPDLHR